MTGHVAESVIAWCGFVGAWLLVAGPVYQAAVELEEESFNREAMVSATRALPPPERLSPWWWLLPPVGYVLNRRRTRSYQRALFASLPAADREQWLTFANKATGWIFVAGGAFFIAVKETWELLEISEWPLWLLAPVTVAMIVVAALNTVLRVRSTHAMLTPDTGGR